MDQIRAAIDQVARVRGVRVETNMLNADPPAPAAAEVIKVIESACTDLNLSNKRMVSRAYHDSLFMARLAPIAMIFIPCRNGVSHRPDEFAKPEDIALGARILALALAKLASE